ncbi:MAG: hypothetical protein JWR50_1713 [Mucilaginibacter sp.]|nr:hypothetical protein [Mucilaginibacter sp.]
MQTNDIVIIGSGIACTSTLIELFNNLIANNNPQDKLSITVIEKHHELWKGIPYGSRSSQNALTITSINDFFTSDKERALFFEWLYANMEELNHHYILNNGDTAKTWYENNRKAIEAHDWYKVYIPRFIFGKYQLLRFNKTLKTVEEKGLATLNTINAEAINVKVDENDLYEVTFEKADQSTDKVKARKLVVATGSAPSGEIVDPSALDDNILYIKDVYDPSTETNIEKIRQVLSSTGETEKNILIIGSNASSLEFLYLLSGHADIKAMINKITVLSKSGSLPNHISNDTFVDNPLIHLGDLKAKDSFDINTLIDAARKDIRIATQDGVVITSSIDKIIGCTIEMLNQLDDDAKNAFFGIYGMQLSNIFRRAGNDYKGGAQSWINSGQLQLVKGAAISLESEEGLGVINYIDENNLEKKHDARFKIVINCSGSDNLDSSSSRLLYNLVHNKLCKMNLSGKGVYVNDKFEAAPNLYVIGPLLGGNRNNRIYFWHLENASRLMYLAPYLAKELAEF